MALDLPELAARVPRPDDAARGQAGATLGQLFPSVRSLGRLGELSIWLAGVQGRCPTIPLRRIRLVGFAAGPGTSVLADLVGAGVRTIDVAADGGTSRSEAETAFRTGMSVADDEIDAGADALVTAGLDGDGDVAAATVAALLTGKDVASVVGSGSTIDDRAWMRRCAAVRDTARRGRPVLRGGADMLDVLAAIGGTHVATLTGLIVQAAVRRTPVVLDGLATCAAAAVARRVSSRIPPWLVAGHRSPDPGHAALLDKLRLAPIVDLQIGLENGAGALLAVPALRGAALLLADDGFVPGTAQ